MCSYQKVHWLDSCFAYRMRAVVNKVDTAPELVCVCVGVAQVIKRLPNLKKLDGIPVDVDEREQALGKT